MKNQFLEVSKKLESIGVELDQFYVTTIWKTTSKVEFQGYYNQILSSKLITNGFDSKIEDTGFVKFTSDYCTINLS